MGTLQMNTTQGVSGEQSKLEVSMTRKDEKTLLVRYRFGNGNARNAFLFNKLYHGISDRGVYSTDTNLVNIEMGQEVEIVLSKKIVPVPMEIDVEKAVTPLVTQVQSHQFFEETIVVPLPLTFKTSYLIPRYSTAKDMVSSRPVSIWFELGFFFAPSGGEKLAMTVLTSSDHALYFDPFPISSQQVMRVGPFRMTLPIYGP